MTLASDGSSLTGVWFDDQKHYGSSLSEYCIEETIPLLTETKRWLDIYFSGREPGFTLPLLFRGTSFHKTVWRLLLTVPYGRTVTYGELARQIGQLEHIQNMSSRAIGAAVGRNPISLIVPCHRVIAADGSLTGYAGGIERKAALLRLEGIECSDLRVKKTIAAVQHE